MSVDPIQALVLVLEADAGVTGLTSNIIGGELPKRLADQGKTTAVVLRPSGGSVLFRGSYQEIGDTRVDVFSYGRTPQEAYTVHVAVHKVLKQMRRTVQNGTMLHWCQPDGGPLSLRDPDTAQPYVLSTWQVLAAEREA